MLTKTLLVAILATCAAPSGAAANPNRPESTDPPEFRPPPEPPQEGQAFCCLSVDKKTKSGDGCGAISNENINSCDKILHCAGDYIKEDGTVTCL
jgi:hypothetical protein